MQHQEFESPEELRDTIKCFWYDSKDFGDLQSGFEVLPDGYAEIIFHFGSLNYISENGASQQLPSPFMIGLLNKPVHFYTKYRLDIIGIRFFPWTVFDLLGLPAGNDGVRTFAHPIATLQSGLQSWIQAGDIDEAINYIKQYFLNARAQFTGDGVLVKAGVAMSDANGALPISQVAAAAHATVRTPERKFMQSSGHTVKDVSVLMRFEQVRNQLLLDPHYNLAGLAHELGYTDQSHLSREFKRYSGTTPAAFARKVRKGKRFIFNDFVIFTNA